MVANTSTSLPTARARKVAKKADKKAVKQAVRQAVGQAASKAATEVAGGARRPAAAEPLQRGAAGARRGTSRRPVSLAPIGSAQIGSAQIGSARAGRAPVGRYDSDFGDVRYPATGVGAMPPSANADMVMAAIADPWDDRGRRVFASVNRRVDVIEHELSRHLISDGAYHAGRKLQAMCAHLGRIGASNWCGTSRTDPTMARERQMVAHIANARRVQAELDRVAARLGMIGLRLLRRVLVEQLTYAQCAGLQGKSGERGQRYVALRFREALEELAGFWEAKGRARPAPDDDYRDAAVSMVEREDASLEAGATEARLGAEAATGTAAERTEAAATLLRISVRRARKTSRSGR